VATSPIDLFVRLSSALTGIATGKLAPPLDPLDIKQVYFDYAKQAEPTRFARLLKIVEDNLTLPPDQLATLVLNGKDDGIRFLARSVTLAWYLGNWYKPDDLERYAVKPPLEPPAAPIDSRVISMNAYIKGWAWSVAQAHPMGFSTHTYGYWSEEPPPLADYIGTGG
jgi:hypothetical protein